MPHFAEMRNATEAFARFVDERLAAGDRVILAAGTMPDLRLLSSAVERELETRPELLPDWDAAAAAAPGTIGALMAELAGGFAEDGIVVVAFADLMGFQTRGSAARSAAENPLAGGVNLRLGDAVIHIDHGMGVLRGLETIEADEVASEVVKLDYVGDTSLFAPIDEISRIWRYEAEGSGVVLDRLDGEGWAKRRAAVEEQVAQTARALLDLARTREEMAAPVLRPPRREYGRFGARFPFTETEDQARATEATLHDLASGKPMDRLVCGYVGFGKTEVALRAAAAAVLAGKQVAVVAPTTVLVRQHLQTFRRRFAGLGVRVEALSRLTAPADARAARVRAGARGAGGARPHARRRARRHYGAVRRRRGRVLLSTNIIETGLDVPGANTMLIWHADRFGVSQLHQLRGRVGRGRVRAMCYLLTDPAAKVAPATERRLRTLETLDRLGAGFEISARDLDLRGAGDLLGEAQAGHVKLVGVELYQDLLQRALAEARGEHLPDEWAPELNFDVQAGIPAGYVPEEEIRLNLYARLARARAARDVENLAAEIEDRFGAMPEEVSYLLALARLGRACACSALRKSTPARKPSH
jgi:transcription-repair coupling factor (superfamily II helicase)